MELKELKKLIRPAFNEELLKDIPEAERETYANYKIFPIAILKKAEWNYKKESEITSGKLRASLKEFGQTETIHVRLLSSGYYEVINGNHRYDEALALEKTTLIAYDHGKISKQEAIRRTLATNELKFEADRDVLAKLIKEAKDAFGLEGLNMLPYTEEEINNFSALVENGGKLNNREDNFDPASVTQTDIKEGDLFLIETTSGRKHRLLCGDSRVGEVVARVLDGAKPYLMITDQPYGVEYDPNWRNETERSDGTKVGASSVLEVKNDDITDWRAAWAHSPAKVAYVWHSGKFSRDCEDSLIAHDFITRAQIIWVKDNFAISRGNYHWKHEPAFYSVKKNADGKFIGDRKQSTVWEIPKPLKNETGHSTQKPVECMGRPIRNHEGDVYDPFVGSGTTLVASEQLGRNCYAIDLNPICIQQTLDRIKAIDPEVKITKL